MSIKPRPAEDRFWPKVDASGICWTWTAYRNPSGYGTFREKPGPMTPAHRWAWEYLVGPIPAGLHLDHLCRNRACVNPDHLEPVTKLVNDLRGMSVFAIKARQTHCIRGHLLQPRVPGVAAERRCRTCSKLRDSRKHSCPVCLKEVTYNQMRRHQRSFHPSYTGPRL